MRASHCGGFSCCEVQPLSTQAQQFWHMGLVAPWHMESSQSRNQTCVLYIGRQIVIHCTTMEVHIYLFRCAGS